jgi:hypothetical protein
LDVGKVYRAEALIRMKEKLLPCAREVLAAILTTRGAVFWPKLLSGTAKLSYILIEKVNRGCS